MQERQRRIKELLAASGQVTVKKLAQKFKVSAATIRHDLSLMEQAGLLTRTFGGAVTTRDASPNLSFEEKRGRNKAAKKAIAKSASGLIREGMTLFVDAGTSTFALLPYLAGFRFLRIFTVDLNLALRLVGSSSCDVFILGGRISHKTASTDSATTVARIGKLRFDLAFIGCDGFDQQGVYITSENKAAIKRAAMASADKSVLLADGSKFGVRAVRQFASISAFSYLVTTGIDPSKLPHKVQQKIILGGN